MPIRKEKFRYFYQSINHFKTMKKLIILFFSIFSLFSYSQEDFKKKIAQDACKCIGEIKLEKKSKEMMQMQLGLCFIKVSTPYKE